MKEYGFYKADDIVSDEPVEGAIIRIDVELPRWQGESIRDTQAMHKKQAEELARIMYDNLPQGTFDLLVHELWEIRLKKYHSVYRGKTTF